LRPGTETARRQT